ncbi:type I polyketide synthase [Paraliomyxa miuraensis]|uniref:type I polyketide synthase n=1 Tax=Paraliomyxa miuraensis TaxID=376150 RepID=UPI0022538DB3|nr:type I polyketide synthase [Paraliomyxa miuraensis]MCX4247333.1 SDR family NAD(P)-dependent oxidoreductase [Paraliomyxa miuraensis]
MTMISPDERLEGIAIIGMACRFPGAPDVEAFWQNLCDGVESIRTYSDAELLAAGVPEELLNDPHYVKANAALDDVELFDAEFFGVNPNVAQITDPQHRIFLELAWHAMEHAGYDSEQFTGDIGVFAGLSMNTYLIENLTKHRGFIESHGLLQAAMANRGDHLATSTAYKLDLHGPAFVVQSACSTSLSAVHLACQSLLSHQTDMALAGGVSVRVPQTMGYVYEDGGVASPDGHCRPFDAQARGTVFGSGAGIVVLRRLEDALSAGDTIHAVIAGSAANNDGAAKIGYTAPSSEGQRKVIAMAQAVASIHPDTIGYVECHGTGTVLGDPIELEALTRAFAAKTKRRQYCAIGSVKSNIGHLDTAAGMAGLIKTALCLSRGKIPPTLHFESPNPELGLESGPFYVNPEIREWPAPDGHGRRAGVSSFGIGGTNVHLVLEEAPLPPRPSTPSRPWHTLMLSARSAVTLEAQTDALREHLAAHPELDLGDVAHTLHLGRRRFEHRRALLCRTTAEAVQVLERLPPDQTFSAQHEGSARPVAFLFPGVGSQHPTMVRELHAEVPEVRRHLDECIECLSPLLGIDLRSILLPGPGQEEHARAALERARVAEPALFAVEHALARSLMAWGVRPTALLGEGIGEYVAACVAGAVSLPDAVRMVAMRSEQVERSPRGAMLAVLSSEAALRSRMDELGWALASIGRDSSCVVSGPLETAADFERSLTAEGISWRRLRADRALHSPVVGSVAARLTELLRPLSFQRPRIPCISGATGRWIQGEWSDPTYWGEQMQRCARLSEGIARLWEEPDRLAVEVGPGRAMTNMARLHPTKSPRHVVLPAMVDEAADASPTQTLTATLARLSIHGAETGPGSEDGTTPRRRVPLPLYPFERRRYWLEPPVSEDAEEPLPPRRADLADWFFVPSWKRVGPPTRAAGSKDAGAGKVVLLFADAYGLAERLAAQLDQDGHTVVRVMRGDQYRAIERTRYAIEPARPQDYHALWQDLGAAGTMPSRVIHMWGVEPYRNDGSRLAALPGVYELGMKSLIRLAQAVGPALREGPLHLDVITSQVQEVTGDEVLCPEKATILGPVLVMGQEYTTIRPRLVDVALPAPGGAEEARLVQQLVEEVESDADEPLVAYRGPHRWVKSHEPMRVEPSSQPASSFRHGGTYLITGGLGGIGLTLAEQIARIPGTRLVLLGRKAPSEHPESDTSADSGAASRPTGLLARIRRLEQLGAELMIVSGDVSDRARMRELLADVRARFAPLNGVIHAAGVPASGAIQRKTDDMMERVLAPKVVGTLVLDELLADEDLDFVVYCSSRTAVLGGFGQADYAAANAFLDAFARHKSRTSRTRTMSIAWCAWKEVGMLARAADARAPGTATSRPVATGHPLLGDRVVSTPEREIYENTFSAETHWILSDHRILGTPVIAGTTYLEMVRAALAPRVQGMSLEIFDISFLNPLAVRLGEARIARLELTRTTDGYAFGVSSRAPEGSEGQPMQHVIGNARLVPGQDRGHELPALQSRCPRERTMSDADARDDDHGPRWQCVRHVRWGDGEVLATLELPVEFVSDLDQLALHPSMLDKAIGTGRDFIIQGIPYIPFGYESLVIRHPMTQRIFVHTRARGEDVSRSETPSFDVTIMDGAGRELVEIRGFSLKRINDVAAVYRNLARRDAMTATLDGTSARQPTSIFDQILREEGVLPNEGAEIWSRALGGPLVPNWVISTRDVEAMLARGMVHTSATRARPLAELEEVPQRDRRRRPALATPYVGAQTPLQSTLVEIFAEALGLDQVGIDDNFFDLGGDSILAMRLAAQIRAHTERDLQVVQLFASPTIADLAVALGEVPSEPEIPARGNSAERGARRRARAIARQRGRNRE